jgi:hypothetical protein
MHTGAVADFYLFFPREEIQAAELSLGMVLFVYLVVLLPNPNASSRRRTRSNQNRKSPHHRKS